MDRGPYRDRAEAGRELGRTLARRGDLTGADVVVLALPRGGVPVGAAVAAELGAPLDVLVVRKLGLPAQPELAMGAVTAAGGELVVVRHEPVLTRVRVSPRQFDDVLAAETEELRRREESYRGGRPPADVAGRTVVLVDDGLATGSSMRAAVEAVRRAGPDRVVVAVPVGAADTCMALGSLAEEVVCPWTPEPFYGVGQGYDDFAQTTDEEVRRLLTA